MKDKALHLEINFPAAGAAVQTGTLDLGVDNPGASVGGKTRNFSDQWRLGRLRVTVPALPNNTDNTKTITVRLQDSGDYGATFADTNPQIQVNIAGVAATGSAAALFDVPLPPDVRGPVQFTVTVPAGAGDNTAQLLEIDWVNE
jgi:hypothetical protein